MIRTRNTLYLALSSALFLFAGTFTLRAAATQQTGDQTDSSSTTKSKQKTAANASTTDSTATSKSKTPQEERGSHRRFRQHFFHQEIIEFQEDRSLGSVCCGHLFRQETLQVQESGDSGHLCRFHRQSCREAVR